MVKEGLEASDEKVMVWSNHKRDLIRLYRLVNPELRRPFLFLKNYADTLLYNNDAEGLMRIISAFEDFLISNAVGRMTKLLEIDVKQFTWKHTGDSIQKYIKSQGKVESINQLIKIFASLAEIYKADLEDIVSQYKTRLEEFVSRIQIRIQKNEQQKSEIESSLLEWQSEKTIQGEV